MIKIGLAALFVVCYFFLIRPARIAFTEHIAYPSVKKITNDSSTIKTTYYGQSLHLKYQIDGQTKAISYRPEFGFFFLIAGFTLLFLTFDLLPYKLLGGLHLAASVSIFAFLMLGASGESWSFILADAIGAYVTPALSLAIVPLVMRGDLLRSTNE